MAEKKLSTQSRWGSGAAERLVVGCVGLGPVDGALQACRFAVWLLTDVEDTVALFCTL